MIRYFNRLLGQIFYYGVGDAATKFIAVLILPLFSRYLTPADFGVASIITLSTALISSLADLGLSVSTYRFYYDEKDKSKLRLISTAQIFTTLVTILMAAIAIIFSQSLSQVFFKTSEYSYIIILAFLSIPLSNLIVAPLNRLKLENKAKIYANIQIIKAVTDIIFKVILIIFLKRGLAGLFEGQIINASIYAAIFLIYTFRTTGFGFSYSFLKKMLCFGLPFAFSPIFFWVLNWVDRLILSRLTNMTEVGLYTLGYNIGMAIMLPVGAFTTAWPAFYMSVVKDKQLKRFFSLVLTYFSLIIGYFILLIIIFSRDYFYFFMPPEFHSAYTVVPFIAFSYLFLGYYSIMITGTYLKRKTFYIFMTEITAMMINLGLLFLLVPSWGRIGAAWATLLSYLTLPIIIYIFTYKIFPIKYEYKRLFQILIAILVIFWLNQLLYSPTVWNLFLRLFLSLLYPLILLLMGFFGKTEMRLLKSNFVRYTTKIKRR